MKSEFKNSSTIESICNVSDVKRPRGEEQIARMSEQIQCWQRNPDKYIEFVTGSKLFWYQKMWIRLEIMRRRIL